MSDLPAGFVLDQPQVNPGLPDGFTLDQPPSYWDTAADIAKSAGTGLANGVIGIAGIPGDIRRGVNWASNKLGILPLPAGVEQSMASNTMLPSSADISAAVQNKTGQFYQPQTTGGKYAESVGEMAPAVFAGPGGLVRKSLQALGSGIGAQAAGDAAQGTGYEPLARAGGAIVGGFAPNIASRVVTPLPISAARQQALDTLANEGVTSLTAGQKSGNIPLRYAESIFGDAPFSGGKAAEIQNQGLQQYTQAAGQRAGLPPGSLATPDVLQQNYDRLRNEFESLSARNNLRFDPQFAQDINNAYGVYHNVVPGSQQKAIVDGYFNDILSHAQNGQTMPGTAYQEMRSRLSRQAQGLYASDPTTAQALSGIRDALDSAMARSISPQDAQAWNLARQQYGAQKVLEKAASRAGGAAAEGYVTPQGLRGAIAQGQTNAGAYARGQGQFADLARAGNVVMNPLPNSGTAQRWMEIGGMLGGGEHLFQHGLTPEAMAVAAGAVAGPGIAGRALFSRPIQAYLSNQVIGTAAPAAAKQLQRARLVDALIQASRNGVSQQSY